MEAASNILLNRVFTRNTFKALIEEEKDDAYYAAIRRYVNDPEGKRHQEIICEIYQKLRNEYRNEYYYKNTLLNKLLLGVHKPTTTTALTEVQVNKSKADFVLINGKAVVYEIKTELDNLDRLEKQLQDYYKAFVNVCVVTSDSNYDTVRKKLEDSSVGIYVLSNSDTISLKKKAENNFSHLDLSVIFKILRKHEYESILASAYGGLPKVSQFKYFTECKKMFEKIDVIEAHNLFIKELKKRNRIDIEPFAQVPREIKSIIYFSNYHRKDYDKLNNFLKSVFGG
jgi:hypothetical protein